MITCYIVLHVLTLCFHSETIASAGNKNSLMIVRRAVT